MFLNNDNDYNLPNMNLKKGHDNLGNDCIVFENKTGELRINNDSYTAQNIAVYINDEIYIKFEDCNIEKNSEYEISFISDDNWLIDLTCHDLNMNKNQVCGYASDISCKKGRFKRSDVNRSFYFIENLELNNIDETNFKINDPNKLKLIVRQYASMFNINGCIYFEDKSRNQKYEKAIEGLKHLVNYYSADMASMRISCKCCDENNSFELNFKPISKYNHFDCKIPFIGMHPGNFAAFIMSSYQNYLKFGDKINNINYIIDYLSYLHREKYGDVQIAISCIVLEMFNNLYGTKIQGNVPAFIQRLNKVLDELKLDSKKLDSFFREKNLLCNDGTVSEIYAIRNRAFHGKSVSNIKISCLLSSFVTILFLRLLEIDCYIQLPVCGSENINTKKFVSQFLKDGNTKSKNHNNDSKRNVVEFDGKYYFPLRDLENEDIDENDEYILVEYNKKSDTLLFRQVDE